MNNALSAYSNVCRSHEPWFPRCRSRLLSYQTTGQIARFSALISLYSLTDPEKWKEFGHPFHYQKHAHSRLLPNPANSENRRDYAEIRRRLTEPVDAASTRALATSSAGRVDQGYWADHQTRDGLAALHRPRRPLENARRAERKRTPEQHSLVSGNDRIAYAQPHRKDAAQLAAARNLDLPFHLFQLFFDLIHTRLRIARCCLDGWHAPLRNMPKIDS